MSSIGHASVNADTSSSSGFEIPTIDVKVTDYYQVADGSTYDKHIFVVNIHVESISWSTDRSYVDFVDLDRKLRKKFPKTFISKLPLEGSPIVEKWLVHEKSDRRRSSNSFSGSKDVSRDLLSGQNSTLISSANTSTRGLKIRENDKKFQSKVFELDNYMVSLLSLHEIVVSDEIMLFLDQEASSMAVDLHDLLPLSVHDLVLINEPVNKRNVSRFQEHTFQVRQGQFVVWRFETANYDIGFSVEINGESKVAMTRYKSHEAPVYGALEANQNAICKLKWDNSYAKLRTKQLSWRAKVVPAEDYHSAHASAMEVQREKRKFEEQRHALKRSALRHASLIAGLTLETVGSSVVSEQDQEEKLRFHEMEDEMLKLRQEVSDFQLDIETANKELEEMEEAKAHADEVREQMQGSWKFTLEELDKAKSDLKDMRKSYRDSQYRTQELEARNATLGATINKYESDFKAYEEREMELTDACKAALDQSDNEFAEAEKKYQKEIKSLQQKMKQFSEEKASEIASSKTEFEKSIKDFENSINQKSFEIETMQSEFSEILKSAIANHEIQLEATKKSVEKSMELQFSTRIAAELQTQAQKLNEDFKTKLDILQRKLNFTETELIISKEKTAKEVAAAIAKAKSDAVQDMDAQAKRLEMDFKVKIADLEERLSSTEIALLSSKENASKDVAAAIEIGKAEINQELQAQAQRLEDDFGVELADLEEKLNNAENALSTSKETAASVVEQGRDDFDQIDARHKALLIQFDELEAQNNDLLTNLQSAELQTKIVEQRETELREANEDAVRQLENEISELKASRTSPRLSLEIPNLSRGYYSFSEVTTVSPLKERENSVILMLSNKIAELETTMEQSNISYSESLGRYEALLAERDLEIQTLSDRLETVNCEHVQEIKVFTDKIEDIEASHLLKLETDRASPIINSFTRIDSNENNFLPFAKTDEMEQLRAKYDDVCELLDSKSLLLDLVTKELKSLKRTSNHY